MFKVTFAGLKAKDKDKSQACTCARARKHTHAHTAEIGPDKSSGLIKNQPT